MRERIHRHHRKGRRLVHRLLPEIPGANGQGKTKDESRENLANAIALILEARREEGLRGVPPDAIRETIMVT